VLAAHAAGYAAVVGLTSAGALAPPLALCALSALDGSLFGCGLGLSGMTSPARIAQFLDVSEGTWNPTLMFVMGGALLLATPFLQLAVLRRGGAAMGAPLLGGRFALPTNSTIDAKLLAGGVLFGSGWAIGGMCPGPALVNLASPHGAPLIFVGTMFAGLALSDSKQVCGCLGG